MSLDCSCNLHSGRPVLREVKLEWQWYLAFRPYSTRQTWFLNILLPPGFQDRCKTTGYGEAEFMGKPIGPLGLAEAASMNRVARGVTRLCPWVSTCVKPASVPLNCFYCLARDQINSHSLRSTEGRLRGADDYFKGQRCFHLQSTGFV